MTEVIIQKTNIVVPLISVDMTNEDAELFKYLLQHYEQIKRLEAGGLFKIKGRTFTIHTDNGGNIKRIDTSLVTFNDK